MVADSSLLRASKRSASVESCFWVPLFVGAGRSPKGPVCMQALYWAWSHAIPLRLQPLQGNSPSLPSAAPGAAPGSKHTKAAHSSSPAASAPQAGEASTDYSTGTFLAHHPAMVQSRLCIAIV